MELKGKKDSSSKEAHLVEAIFHRERRTQRRDDSSNSKRC